MKKDAKPALRKYGDFYKLRVDVSLKGATSKPLCRELISLFNGLMEVDPAITIGVFAREGSDPESHVPFSETSDQSVFYVNIRISGEKDAHDEIVKISGMIFYSLYMYHTDEVAEVRCRVVTLEACNMAERYSAEIDYNYDRFNGFMSKRF